MSSTEGPSEIVRYALVVRIPREVEVRMEDLYLSLTGATKPVMGYHITLLGPFGLAEGETELAVEGVEAVCRQQEPFGVELKGMHVSAMPNSNAVLVDIAYPRPLVSLHRKLYAALREQILFGNTRTRRWNLRDYHPHVTVALGLSDKELDSFPVESSSQQCHARFQVTHLSLAAEKPYEPWRHIRTFPLGARKQHPDGAAGLSSGDSSPDGASYS